MMPKQKPGKSKQDYGTPPELLRAIECDFGVHEWACDLAANAENAICPRFFSPDDAHDSLDPELRWNILGDLWLNPPFAHVAPWAAKCRSESLGRVGRIFLLVPASVGSNWYADHVHQFAHVVALSPRVTFVGETTPYPKDLILAIYGSVRGGFSTWRWKP